ncbi:hypothetical protein AAG570_001953 [Ranatra chinensis]|uniref:Uncharacterized protein n=1 Tax=Ranatra chinensis TaxID=642074 RepID=A0ABD0YSK6_9HEMI
MLTMPTLGRVREDECHQIRHVRPPQPNNGPTRSACRVVALAVRPVGAAPIGRQAAPRPPSARSVPDETPARRYRARPLRRYLAIRSCRTTGGIEPSAAPCPPGPSAVCSPSLLLPPPSVHESVVDHLGGDHSVVGVKISRGCEGCRTPGWWLLSGARPSAAGPRPSPCPLCPPSSTLWHLRITPRRIPSYTSHRITLDSLGHGEESPAEKGFLCGALVPNTSLMGHKGGVKEKMNSMEILWRNLRVRQGGPEVLTWYCRRPSLMERLPKREMGEPFRFGCRKTSVPSRTDAISPGSISLVRGPLEFTGGGSPKAASSPGPDQRETEVGGDDPDPDPTNGPADPPNSTFGCLLSEPNLSQRHTLESPSE